MSDNINHPSHYNQGGIECIKAIEASMSPEGFQDFCKGNVLKYIWRWRDKAGIEDLKKAQEHLNQRGNSENLMLEYMKVDVACLKDCARKYYLRSLVDDLRICSSGKGCHGCRREPTENGCDLLESEAADAIEFLLKELKEKKNENT